MSEQTPSVHRALVALMRPAASRWVALGALVGLGAAGLLTGPIVVRAIVDRARAGATTGEIARLAVVYLVIAVLYQVLNLVVVRRATALAWSTTNGLRLRISRHVLGLDHEFHRRHTPGELIQRVDGDVTNVSTFLGIVVPQALGALFLITGITGVLLVLDWRLGVAMVVYLALVTTIVIRSRHRAIDEATDEMSSLATLYGGIEERLTASEDLRANGAAGHANWRFVEDSTGTLGTTVSRERAFIKLWWIVQGGAMFGAVLALVASATLAARGAITVGTALLLVQYVFIANRPLEDLIQQLETVQKATGAMRHVVDLLAVKATIVDTGTTSPPPGPLSIRFRDVSFSYADQTQDQTPDNEERILRDVDVEIGAGRSVGVVGRTGSGKTTFSRLILRLVEPTSGRVELGGVPVADIPMAQLRSRVALVPQEVELFDGTIRDNVTLFDPGPTDDDVIQALNRAGLSVLARAGIHRNLGAGGAGLSAGEAQLLAFARVWLRAPDLVVLDEATARIDPVTELRLEAAVNELSVDRTVVIIAHRLSTLRGVDEILVFDHGRVVEHDDRAMLTAMAESRFRRLLDLALETGEEPNGVGERLGGAPSEHREAEVRS